MVDNKSSFKLCPFITCVLSTTAPWSIPFTVMFRYRQASAGIHRQLIMSPWLFVATGGQPLGMVQMGFYAIFSAAYFSQETHWMPASFARHWCCIWPAASVHVTGSRSVNLSYHQHSRFDKIVNMQASFLNYSSLGWVDYTGIHNKCLLVYWAYFAIH